MPFCRTMNSAPTRSDKTPKATSEVRARCSVLRRVGYRQVADDAEHRAVEQRARQHCRNRRRTFAVRVRQPGMHWGEADFGAVADQHQQIRQRGQCGIHLGRCCAQAVPGHVVGRPKHETAAPVEQHGSEQSEADPGGNDDDVLPGRLDAFGRPLESDQERAHQRGQFDRDPVETGIVHDRAQQDRQGEAGKQRIEAPQPVVFAEQAHVADRVNRSEQSRRSRCKASPMRRSCRRPRIRRDNSKARCAQHCQRDSGGEHDETGSEIETFGNAGARVPSMQPIAAIAGAINMTMRSAPIIFSPPAD